MGAHYDLVISPAFDHDSMVAIIGDFLSTRLCCLKLITKLEFEEINGQNAILLSPPANGWVEIQSGTGVGIDSSWYSRNILACYLSKRLYHCIHIWSLNSGYVAGYAIYANGENVECENTFSKYARDTSELMEGVPTPPIRPGQLLESLFGIDCDFLNFMARYESLEIGMAELVARMGFKVHLVDYYDATDDKQGIEISDGKYQTIPLTGWMAILFDCER